MSSVGSSFSYINDARSHEPKDSNVNKVCEMIACFILTSIIHDFFFGRVFPVHTVHLGPLVSQGFKVLLVPQAPQVLLDHLVLIVVTSPTQSQHWREMDCLVLQDPEALLDPLGWCVQLWP